MFVAGLQQVQRNFGWKRVRSADSLELAVCYTVPLLLLWGLAPLTARVPWHRHLEHNLLGGVIPEQLTQLPLLSQVVLANNAFIGGIPNFFSDSMVHVSVLAFDHNLLGGAVPSVTGFHHSLRQFTASYNLLSGSLPDSIGNFPSLEDLCVLAPSHCFFTFVVLFRVVWCGWGRFIDA